ncbi:MAG: PQQ-dependent sugar dehydrogenase [Opitutaceae bacterium]
MLFPLPLRFSLVCFLAPLSLVAQGTVTVQLADYATVPQSGGLDHSTDNAVYVARVNFLREEPGGGLNRLFVCDLNGKLYVLDKSSRQFVTYLDFQRNASEAPGATGLFPAFTRAAGYASGLVTFQFDPEYRNGGSSHFGKFYTVHIETDTNDGDARRIPNASAHPGVTNASSYTATAVNETPGTDNANTRHAVLVEWQDTSIADHVFQGPARELLRIEFNGRIHPIGDLLFNPAATNATHPDWRHLYIAVGDGGAGEQNNAVLHPTPQRLDVLQGKILRILPDDSDGTGPRRYTIPADNPFGTSNTGAMRGEIWAYGFRNPHRIAWDSVSNLLIASDIGFHTWEEVNIVRRGANYGYGEREGTFVLNLQSGNASGALPANDAASSYVYPVIQYPHSPALGYGDAIAGGFVYRGSRLPQLQGKFVFGDITTGQLFHADLAALVAADDGNPATLASFQRIEVLWDNPRNAAGLERFDRMHEIVAGEYRARGGTAANLPGSATVSDLTGGGRADIRFAMDAAGELFLLSKSDGMIRSLMAAPPVPAAPTVTRQPQSQSIAPGGTVAFAVEASSNAAGYQWKRNGAAIAGANNPILVLPNVTAAQAGSYTVDASNPAGTVTSAPATLAVFSGGTPGRIANFSIRSNAGAGAQTLIVGLVIDGDTAANGQMLLIRGVGPTLTAFGVASPLPDPKLEFFRGATKLLENDNWDATTTAAALASQVNAFALPSGSRDATIQQAALTRGAYTVQLSSAAAGESGIVLAEIFDATPPGVSARELVNVSARTQVAGGDNILIAGFVIGGTTARTVLMRAAGPVLSTFGVTGALADPTLTLFRDTTPIAESDNWQSSVELVNAFATAGAFNFNARSRDAVLLITLPPGSYTAQVSGVAANASGVALAEIYALP